MTQTVFFRKIHRLSQAKTRLLMFGRVLESRPLPVHVIFMILWCSTGFSGDRRRHSGCTGTDVINLPPLKGGSVDKLKGVTDMRR